MASYCKREVPFTLHSKIDYNWLQFLTVDMMIFACWLASWIVLGHTVKVSIVEWTDWNTYLVGQMWLLIWMKLHFNHVMLWSNPFTSGKLKIQVGDVFIGHTKILRDKHHPNNPRMFTFLYRMFFLVKTVTPFEDCWWLDQRLGDSPLRCFLGWLGWWCRSIPSSNRGGPSVGQLWGDDECRKRKSYKLE